MEEFPHVPPQLLKALKEAFPETLPSKFLSLNDKEVGALFGKQEIIQFLEGHLLQQEINVPT